MSSIVINPFQFLLCNWINFIFNEIDINGYLFSSLELLAQIFSDKKYFLLPIKILISAERLLFTQSIFFNEITVTIMSLDIKDM